MIKLDLPAKPAAFTDELVQELTAKFKVDGSSVWKKKFIEQAVSETAFGKCCYSESLLGEEGKYMELDHFYAKSIFPDKVVEWGNLLPSNKKCNATKGEHNVAIEPIVNPYIDDPKAHFYIRGYRFYPKTEIGRTTIDVVALNDRDHFVSPRAKIGHEVSEILNDIYAEITEERELILSTPGKRRRILAKAKGIMKQGTRKNEYSATISTIILTDEYYPAIEKFFVDNGLWDAELAGLKAELEFCCLIK